MAARFGYASENENWANYDNSNNNNNLSSQQQIEDSFQRAQQRRQSRRATLRPNGANAPHQITFKPFTRESLLNSAAVARRRKQSQQVARKRSTQANNQRLQSTVSTSTTTRDDAQDDAAAGVELLSVEPRSQRIASASNNPSNQSSREPDPYLASGQQLPPAIVRHLPKKLVGTPIEDIDPYYADRETFVIISRGNELIRFSAKKALYLFGPFHPIRRIVLCILVSSTFNLLVILTILTNCVLMTFQGSETVERTEIIFTVIYTIEMCLKVLARGFIMEEFTYLRDPWNWLDFAVIVMAYLTIVVEDLGNLSVMRTFRVLRALKTVAIISGMKTIVGAVIDSVKNLKDVVVLTLFSLSVFSLLGLQIYMGLLTQKCILNGPSNMTDTQWFQWCNNSSHWIPDTESEIYGSYRLCGNATGAQSCPPTHTCLQGFGPNPDYGYTNFDTFGWALICSFRLMTQDFWEGLYVQVLKTAGSWHIIFFIVSIFLGSIYLMNLILAIVSMSYNELQRRAEEEEEAAAEDEAVFLETCRRMEMQDQFVADRVDGPDELGIGSPGIGISTPFKRRRSKSEHNRKYRSADGSVQSLRSSYRPSIEIGLVGQSMLASLCQNGLLGEYVRQKLDTQMIRPAGEGIWPARPLQTDSNTPKQQQQEQYHRSHSLSVNLEVRNKTSASAAVTTTISGVATNEAPSEYPSSARGSFCRGAGTFELAPDGTCAHPPPPPSPNLYALAPILGPHPPSTFATSSMTELRRRSSARGSQIIAGSPVHYGPRVRGQVGGGCVRSNSMLVSSADVHVARRRSSARSSRFLSPQESIRCTEQARLKDAYATATSARSSLRPRSSTSSDKGVEVLRRRAAVIRITQNQQSPSARSLDFVAAKLTTDGVNRPPLGSASMQRQLFGGIQSSTLSSEDDWRGDSPVDSRRDSSASMMPSMMALATSVATAPIKMSLDELKRGNNAGDDYDATSVAICEQPSRMYPLGRSRCMLPTSSRSTTSASRVTLVARPTTTRSLRGRPRGSQSVSVSRRGSVAVPEEPDRLMSPILPRPLSPIPAPDSTSTTPPAMHSHSSSPPSSLRARGAKLGGSLRALPVAARPNPSRKSPGTTTTVASPGELAVALPSCKAPAATSSSRQLGVEQPKIGSDRIHLSVENFQQFGAFHPAAQQHRHLNAGAHFDMAEDTSSLRVASSSDGSHLSVTDLRSMDATGTSRSTQPRASVQYRIGAADGSAAHINPMTMVRSSFSRSRLASNVAGAFGTPTRSGAPQVSDGQVPCGPNTGRRMSRDMFVRRASDWSRLSMSTNVDLRRLLRLWLHTNPYQATGSGPSIAGGARPSLGSCSSRLTTGAGISGQQVGATVAARHNSRQQMYDENDSYVHPFWANAQQQKSIDDTQTPVASRPNSHRPSSVGSAWQAYELISAMSRRHTRLRSNLSASNRYTTDDFGGAQDQYGIRSMEQDDDFDGDDDDRYTMDNVSVNMRDKCIAYCLSCMDLICIWECCGIWLKLQRLIALIVFDPFTELFIILCILINTLFMALDSDDADQHMRVVFERANYFFSATFAVEASMKIMALSPKFYFRDGWNVFDAIIVGLSLLELGLEGVYGLSVLRSFRLLRVFKLAKSWPTLNLLISIMGKAVGDVGNLTFVLGIIVFIFAVMGMQLFGNKYVDRNFPSGELPRWNFTDFMHSFMIVFRILCAEWIEPMWDCLLVGGWPCIPFFLIAVTVGNLVVLNLFLALLLASFGASNLSSPQADNVDTRKLQEAIARFKRFGRWIKRNLLRWLRAAVNFILCRCRRSKSKSKNVKVRKRKTNMSLADKRAKYRATGAASSQSIGGGGSEGRASPSYSTSEPASVDCKISVSKPSHIVALSRSERLKNIELRTEELKSRISRSPEHHYHLRQLAQMQIKEASAATQRSGYNYHYEHPSSGQQQAEPMPNIPIIVDEAADLSSARASTEGVDLSAFMATSAATDSLPEAEPPRWSSPLGACSSIEEESTSLGVPIENDESSANSSATVGYVRSSNGCILNNMQPIKEDSKDADSMSISLDGSESNQTKELVGKKLGRNLDGAAQELRLSFSGQQSKDMFSFNDRRMQERQRQMQKCASTGVICGANLAVNFVGNPTKSSSNHVSLRGLDATARQADGSKSPPGKSSKLYLRAPKREEMEEDDEKALQKIEKYIDHYICIGMFCLKWFIFRQRVRRLVERHQFDQLILLLIVISSGTLALEDKHLNDRPVLKQTLDVLDTVFTIVFSLEMIMKWLAFGVRRYFSNIWSWLDFFIVLVSLVNLMASIFGSGKIQALKTMRTLRAMRGLRPLRALQRFQGMRVVVNALIQAIPSIFNVLLVCLIFWLIFSIMGVQMFGGKFWRCLNPEDGEIVSYEEAANKYECIERNLTWANPQINFDNVLNAYLALFQVATFKGWIDIMNSATDSRMRDDQPIREANIYMYFYFVFFVIFGSFFTLNLFIGVIIDNFNEQKKKTGGSLEIFMTDDQKKYYHAMKKMRSKRPIKAMTRPKFKLQAYMFDITTSKKFDLAIMLIIGLNMFVMALEHYGQSPEFGQVLENLNLIFIAIFTLECLCKIFAMRHFYFREPWNIFDFIVVGLSILGVVMKEYVAKYLVSPTLLRVVRVVKVGRVLRLVKGAKGIRTLLFALAMSLPALFNICLLLFLVMFIYAIFGMSFFMNVRKRAGIDETFNFETFSSSIIVLFQMSTSAGWDLVLDPLMDEENDCQKPDPAAGIEGTCGNKGIAIFYLISYVIVTFLIIINMYIAVILENYSQATEDVQEGLTDDDYEMYYEIWQKFDPDGTQYLPYEKLSDFVDALEDPLRIPKPNDLILVVLDINIYEGNQCYCVDILDALTKHFFTRKGLDIQVNEHLQKVQSTLHETPFECIATTFLVKRQHYCARIIQNHWRRWRSRVEESKRKELTDSEVAPISDPDRESIDEKDCNDDGRIKFGGAQS